MQQTKYHNNVTKTSVSERRINK